MAPMLTQLPLPLPLLPSAAAEIAPGVGVVTSAEGGLVLVHGLATFASDSGDEASRRLAAVQLVRRRARHRSPMRSGWIRSRCGGGTRRSPAAGGGGLVPSRKGPRQASKLTGEVVTLIRGLDGLDKTLAEIAAVAGVSVSSVRNALGRGPARAGLVAAEREAGPGSEHDGRDAGPVAMALGERGPGCCRCCLTGWAGMVSGRRRGGGCWARPRVPVFAAGARYPLAGLLLALPPLAGLGAKIAAPAHLSSCSRRRYPC